MANPVSRPLSQTVLSHAENCPHAAHLYLEGHGTESHAMDRGSVFHEMAEIVTRRCIEHGEPTPGGDVAREEAQAIMDSGKIVLPAHEQEAVRIMAWNWGEAMHLDLAAVKAVELMLELDLGDTVIRGKIDLALDNGTGVPQLFDYKTGLAKPSQDRFDKSFQGKFYAVLWAFGKFAHPSERGPQTGLDPAMYGTRVCRSFNEISFREVYPRYREADGGLFSRTYSVPLTKPYLTDTGRTIRSIVARIKHGQDTGEWPARRGSWCSRCPEPTVCPIRLKPVMQPATADQAAQLAMSMERHQDIYKQARQVLKDWVDDHGPVIVAPGEAYTYVPGTGQFKRQGINQEVSG